MSVLPEKLRLKGRAEEDIYFARRDRELIEALRRRRLAGPRGDDLASGGRRPAGGAPRHPGPEKPGVSCRALLDRVRHLLRRRR